jgi:Tol biopolymer transport system component
MTAAPAKYWWPLLFALFLCIRCRENTDPVGPKGTIAFVNRDLGINHIYLMEVDQAFKGFNARRLTAHVESEDYPSWSPDGKSIAFQRGLDGSAIYVIQADGSGERRLSPVPGFDVTPSWSPDGTKIIYVRLSGPVIPGVMPKTEIRITNLDGTGDHVILPATGFSVEPRWSVNNKIVFMGYRNSYMHILTMDTAGMTIQQLTTEGNNGDPAWSPDGTRISFGSDREGGDKLNIYTMDANGSNVFQLTHFDVPYESGDTGWSPDGKMIAFEYDIGGKKQSDPNAYAEIWMVGSNGSNPVSTRQPCSGVGCAPRWRPTP